mmetsp:Transcript_11916/g.46535  ORF Transcript_11916/g.46535 Transcript_11916/m.46535 type:complete len:250 (-) Transcript_11916:230-979(-)
MVGTCMGSKLSQSSATMGTHTRPVFGCTQKGDLSKWLIPLVTFTSMRGYVNARTMVGMALASAVRSRKCTCLSPLRVWATADWSCTQRCDAVTPGAAHATRTVSFRSPTSGTNASTLSQRSVCPSARRPCPDSGMMFSMNIVSRSPRARFSEGWSGTVSGTRSAAFFSIVPLIALKYSTIAERPSLPRARAERSHTQQCTPRRPEYTQKMCLKPKSSLRPRSITRMATVMYGQQRWQMPAPEQQVRISS